MGNIYNLCQDIYELLESGEAKLEGLTIPAGHGKAEFRMSNFAKPDKWLWYLVNKPELGEQLSGQTLLKFNYGHLTEAMIFDLIKQTGKHTVEGEQDEVSYEGLKGHIDAIVDGMVVDVKSANSRGFARFKSHALERDDPFGYLDQLSLYTLAKAEDPRLKVKDKAAFLAFDKELGQICLDVYPVKEYDYASEIKRKRAMLGSPTPPNHCCVPVPYGTSGNMRLGTQCSYNPYKFHCHPGLRAFQYSNGPVFLTKVVREPDVPEVTFKYRRAAGALQTEE